MLLRVADISVDYRTRPTLLFGKCGGYDYEYVLSMSCYFLLLLRAFICHIIIVMICNCISFTYIFRFYIIFRRTFF